MKRIITARDLDRIEATLLRDHAREVAPHSAYRERPLDWVVDKLGISRETLQWSLNEAYDHHSWDGNPDPLVAISEALADCQNVGCESAVGVGKTFFAACLVYWFLATREDSLIVTSAPKEAQLTGRLWKEIEALWPAFSKHFPQATLMAGGEIRMRPGSSRNWRAVAEVVGVEAGAQVAVKAQGWHAKDLLIVVEEAAGAHPAAMAAYENTLTGPGNVMLAIGNPDHREDPLRKFCELPDTLHVRISALDHPNVVLDDALFINGAASRKSVARLEARYAWSQALRDSRVRGISPKRSAAAALSEFDDARHLFDRDITAEIGSGDWPVFIGLDGGRNWAAVLGAVDTEGRMHIAGEAFSRDAAVSDRVDTFLAMLDAVGVTLQSRIRGWYDNAEQVEWREFNKELKQRGLPWKIGLSSKAAVKQAEGRTIPYRVGFVAKANQLLHRDALLFAADLNAGDWTWGADAADDGEPRTGSRLLAEIRQWSYGEPKAGQRSDNPDDRTADGAHSIAALRYLLMPWIGRRARTVDEHLERIRRQRDLDRGLARPAPIHSLRDLPRDTTNRDYGLERIAAIDHHLAGQRRIKGLESRMPEHFRRKKLAQAIERREARKKEREERAERQRVGHEAAHRLDAVSPLLDQLLQTADERGLTEDDLVNRLLGLDED